MSRYAWLKIMKLQWKNMFSQNVVNESCNDEFYDVWMIFDEYVYFMCFMSLKIGNCVEIGICIKFQKNENENLFLLNM